MVETGGFLYDSDAYSDELPYWVEVAGSPHLVVPYTLDANDFKFLLPNGFVTSHDFARYWSTRSTSSEPRAAGCCPSASTAGSSAVRAARPGCAGSSSTSRRLDDVWVATRADIARHWHAEHPPGTG